jgi:hypothetical protein
MASRVVRNLFRIVRLHATWFLACKQPFGLVQRQVRTFDVRRMMRLKDQCPLLHPRDPFLGKRGGIEKAARPLNPGQVSGNGIGDSKSRL